MTTVVIPTYGRENVLVETIQQFLEQDTRINELLIVDQTPQHEASVESRLAEWHECGVLQWIRLDFPSIPRAMNTGLMQATSSIVLFVDDDIRIDSNFVRQHERAHGEHGAGFIVGRVVQPWQSHEAHRSRDNLNIDPDEFDFSSKVPSSTDRVMAGNLSVDRNLALSIGGFDENFTGAAYRFEAEFSDRARSAGISIRFEPRATLDHLHADQGGTRAHGHFLRTASSAHTSGKYYYLLIAHQVHKRWTTLITMPFRSVMTRHHLKRPWWIPVSLVAEFRGIIDAVAKRRCGRQLLEVSSNRPRHDDQNRSVASAALVRER